MRTNDLHITLPASKSISNRWLMLNYEAGMPFVLHNLSTADDTQLLQALLAQLKHGRTATYHCRNAGTVARFMLALLALTPGQHTLTGDERLLQRPMHPLIECLRGMGCHIKCLKEEGFLPVVTEGIMPDRKMAEIDPVASSQFVSAMMLVGPLLPNGLTLTLTGRAASRPYIEMTRTLLNQAGITATVNANHRVYRVEPMPPAISNHRRIIEIERDWTSAAYVYEAAALVPGLRIRMPGLMLNSCQGDAVLAEIYQHFGVVTHEVRSPYRTSMRSITIEGTGRHDKEFEFNFQDYPDLVPSVATTCAALGIKAHIKGAKNLRYKESDRLKALQTELKKMGGSMRVTAHSANITPTELCPTQPVSDHADHRIAMAFGVLSLKYPSLTIEDPSIVAKSFPTFWGQLNLIRKATDRIRQRPT